MARLLGFAIIAVLLLLALAPAWLSVLGLLGAALPWVVFGLLALAFVGRGPRRRGHRAERYWHAASCGVSHSSWSAKRDHWTDRGWARAPQANTARPSTEAPAQAPRPSAPAPQPLPADVQGQVDAIRRKAANLQGRMKDVPRLSLDLYLIDRITDDYLPKTIDSYLAVPASERDATSAAHPNGAKGELLEQLGLLDSKLGELEENLHRHDFDKLLANRRFLEQRLQTPDPAEVVPQSAQP